MRSSSLTCPRTARARGCWRPRGRRASPPQDYLLPRDLAATPLLSGLTGEQVASLIVEVLHADDPAATAAGRATDLMVMRKVIADAGRERA